MASLAMEAQILTLFCDPEGHALLVLILPGPTWTRTQGVSLAGLLLDELHDCGLQWDCCPWWIAKQEVGQAGGHELQAGGLPAPSRASHYQAALLHSMVKDQGVWEDYLNYCECMGRLLTEWQNLHLKEYYSFHAPALVMPLKQLAGILDKYGEKRCPVSDGSNVWIFLLGKAREGKEKEKLRTTSSRPPTAAVKTPYIKRKGKKKRKRRQRKLSLPQIRKRGHIGSEEP
eukprot:707868-Pelagomonas_calceolata.AAC.5